MTVLWPLRVSTDSALNCQALCTKTVSVGVCWCLQVSRLSAQGARLCQFSDDCAVAEVEARRVAAEQGLTYISPYNDWEVS